MDPVEAAVEAAVGPAHETVHQPAGVAASENPQPSVKKKRRNRGSNDSVCPLPNLSKTVALDPNKLWSPGAQGPRGARPLLPHPLCNPVTVTFAVIRRR